MAKITYTPGWDRVHGHVGTFIYKEQQGRNILARKPDHVKQPNSPGQLAQRENFRQAAAYAKSAMASTEAHAAYVAKAKELRSSPFAVALKDWMTEPEVRAIDLSQYHKHVGDAIYIAAQDDFEVGP